MFEVTGMIKVMKRCSSTCIPVVGYIFCPSRLHARFGLLRVPRSVPLTAHLQRPLAPILDLM